MNRYILFAGDSESARGGWHDYKTSSENLPDLVSYMGQIADSHDWAHIVDTAKMKIVGRIVPSGVAGWDDDPKNQINESLISDDEIVICSELLSFQNIAKTHKGVDFSKVPEVMGLDEIRRSSEWE